jgi:hypothetical protein
MNDESGLPASAEERVAYMDGVEWQHHVEHDADGTHLYPSVESVLLNNSCARQCGVVRVAIRELDWPIEQNFNRVTPSVVADASAESSEARAHERTQEKP